MLPCGEVHWKILPAISRELALRLGKEGMPQNRIAALLGTTSAAVSQYKSGKRGTGTRLPKNALLACGALAKRIAGGKAAKQKIDVEISKIVVLAKNSKLGQRDPCMICAGAKA